MKPADIVKALIYPVVHSTTFVAFVSFYLLLQLIGWIIGLGPYHLASAFILMAFIVPALCLYLIFVLDARARGADPDPPGVEHLHWYGSVWSLLQVLYYAFLVYTIYRLGSWYGTGALLVVFTLFAAALPASLAILAVTHSPIESLNPLAIRRLINRCGASYWIAPTFFLAAAFLAWRLRLSSLPDWVTELIGLYLVFAFYTLIGAVVRPHGLHNEVGIYDPVERGEAEMNACLLNLRTDVLNHAYGFISRGNRIGGLRHIRDWIEEDPDPVYGWQWFFEQMLRWEIKDPALMFGQQYLSWLLHNGDYVVAVKVMMRCRMENEAFKPLAEDKALALEAAERCQHEELINLLERS
jgi:hypothetical protein